MTVYADPAAVVAVVPAVFGVSVTLVKASPLINVPVTLKLVVLVPAVKAVPYVFEGPVAVTVIAGLLSSVTLTRPVVAAK